MTTLQLVLFTLMDVSSADFLPLTVWDLLTKYTEIDMCRRTMRIILNVKMNGTFIVVKILVQLTCHLSMANANPYNYTNIQLAVWIRY